MSNTRETHSADVWAQLAVNGHVFEVAQLGPGYLFLNDPIDVPPCEGVLTFRIDESVSVRELRLPFGIAAGRRKTIVAAAASGCAAG